MKARVIDSFFSLFLFFLSFLFFCFCLFPEANHNFLFVLADFALVENEKGLAERGDTAATTTRVGDGLLPIGMGDSICLKSFSC
jgi:hypothetical protein